MLATTKRHHSCSYPYIRFDSVTEKGKVAIIGGVNYEQYPIVLGCENHEPMGIDNESQVVATLCQPTGVVMTLKASPHRPSVKDNKNECTWHGSDS